MSEKIAKTPWNIPYHEVYKVVAAALVIAWQSGPDRYYNLMGAAPTQEKSKQRRKSPLY